MSPYTNLQNHLKQRPDEVNIEHDWKDSINPPSTKLLLPKQKSTILIALGLIEDNKRELIASTIEAHINGLAANPGNYSLKPDLNLERR